MLIKEMASGSEGSEGNKSMGKSSPKVIGRKKGMGKDGKVVEGVHNILRSKKGAI